MDRADHLFILMRAGDREHTREARTDRFGFLAHAAGDDDAAVLRDRLADRFEAFFLRRIEEAAGVDEHDVRARIIGRRSEEHTSEIQSLMRISYAVFCLKKKTVKPQNIHEI